MLVLNDLAVLTPPVLVCAAFLIAVGAFLRHEMGRSPGGRRDAHASGDISGNDTNPDTADSAARGRAGDTGGSGPD